MFFLSQTVHSVFLFAKLAPFIVHLHKNDDEKAHDIVILVCLELYSADLMNQKLQPQEYFKDKGKIVSFFAKI